MNTQELSYYKRSVWIGSAFLIGSLVVNFYSGVYASHRASNYVTDIVLSNIPVFNLDEVFIYSSWLLLIFAVAVFGRRHRKIPFALKTISIFVLVRSIFITLTHMAPFPTAITVDPSSVIVYYVFGGGLFFSGHTGLPFLLSLIFWKDKLLRYVFLISSFYFGAVVLLAHVHYTIDVFSAFFITYGIYRISEYFFKRDLELSRI